jgi:hypothetical protein
MLAGAILFPLMKPRTVRLFECMQPEKETVLRIGPSPVASASELDRIR